MTPLILKFIAAIIVGLYITLFICILDAIFEPINPED